MSGTPKHNSGTRRDFLKKTAAAASALAIPAIVPGSALGRDGVVAPSERITMGGIGIGPRGNHVLGPILDEPDVQYIATCDIRRDRRESVKARADEKYGNNDCETYRDLRDLLARDDIDAVLIATGDRWHGVASIMAMKAGKDVYSEKPCSLTIEQCEAVADTARRYGRVYQAGTQRRSVANFKAAVDLAHSGKLGKIHTLHASSYYPSVTYDWLPEEPLPPKDEIDWDLWLGAAPWRPYNRRYVDGGWRGHWDFDSGPRLLDWCAHTIDLCQWANQTDHTLPIEYETFEDNMVLKYADGVELIVDFLSEPFGDREPHYGTSRGTCPVRFEGEDGWVETGDSGEIAVYPESLRSELPELPPLVGTASKTHSRDFLNCMKTGAPTNANADIMRQSHTACYAAAHSWILGRKLVIDPETRHFIGDDEANRLRTRAMRPPWHL
jgi:predicted dehydrogenase